MQSKTLGFSFLVSALSIFAQAPFTAPFDQVAEAQGAKIHIVGTACNTFGTPDLNGTMAGAGHGWRDAVFQVTIENPDTRKEVKLSVNRILSAGARPERFSQYIANLMFEGFPKCKISNVTFTFLSGESDGGDAKLAEERDAQRKQREQQAEARKKAFDKRAAEEDAQATALAKKRNEELQRARPACHAIYLSTGDKKIADLTVKEEQAVRACQTLGLYR